MILCELGTSSEEIMLVTAMAGDSWTVTRGYDGSTAVAHDLGAKVVHGVSAIDMDEANEHVQASTNVHGLASGAAVVGTTTAQTLTNKTLTSPTLNGGTLNAVTLASGTTLDTPTLITPVIASFVNAPHDHSDAANGGEIEGGGGGSATGLAYRRTRDEAPDVTISSSGDAGAVAVSLDILDYNVGGNATWAVNGASSRITLPTDIANAVWHVSASASIEVEDAEFDEPFINIVHQDEGILATDGGTPNIVSTVPTRRFSASSDFQAASAGRWIELRLGTDGPVTSTYSVNYASISIHRVA
jgi:hypothetical protein